MTLVAGIMWLLGEKIVFFPVEQPISVERGDFVA